MIKTETELQLEIRDEYKDGRSLRKLARKYEVSHGVIQRCLDGKFPKEPAIRQKLGLMRWSNKDIARMLRQLADEMERMP